MRKRKVEQMGQRLALEFLERRELLHGVSVTESHVLTPHGDVPRFANQAEFVAVADGPWSSPATWSLGRVPGAEAQVQIPAGREVVYDLNSVTGLDSIEVAGTVNFATASSTSLWVNEILVLPSGELQIGSDAAPVDSGVTAEVVFRDTATDVFGDDPEQFGGGLIVFGSLEVFGAEKTAHVRSEQHIDASSTSIALNSSPAGWEAGDRILLPETSQTRHSRDGFELHESEVVSLIDATGAAITTEAVTFDHHGVAANPFGVSQFAHVANLTRNVVFRSENPAGHRGHIMASGHAAVMVENASFVGLGRTSADSPIDDTIVDDDYNIVHLGSNPAGRYSLHFHHLMGSYHLSGIVVEDSLKWAITVHNTSHGVVRDSVVYDVDGAAIVTEDGTEIGNSFLNNLVVKVDGGHQKGDGRAGAERMQDDLGRRWTEIGSDGSGFWLRATAGTFQGNAVYDAAGYGFNFNGYYRSPSLVGRDNFQLQQVDHFSHNETASSLGGLWLTWSQGQSPVDSYVRQEFSDFLAWNVQSSGVKTYHDANFDLNNITVIGDATVANTNAGSNWRYFVFSTTGLDFGNEHYENHDLVLRNINVSGTNVGIITPTHPGAEFLLDRARLQSYVNVAIPLGSDESFVKLNQITYIPSLVSRISEDMPVQPANLWHESDGTLIAGELADGIVNARVEHTTLRIIGSEQGDLVTAQEVGAEIELIVGSKSIARYSTNGIDRIEFRGLGGNDVFQNETNLPLWAYGGDGDDHLFGGPASDRLYGELGRDTLQGRGANDLIYGGGDADFIDGGNGDDSVWAGDGNDVLDGNLGNDSLWGEKGDDLLIGGAGADRLWGDVGADEIHGGGGVDKIYGGDGEDRLYGDGDSDTIRGDRGDDFLQGGDGGDLLFGGWGNDELSGGAGNDYLYGNEDNDMLNGNEGTDILSGDAGNDQLFGGDGDDRLWAGIGNDLLVGGAGHDRLDGGDGDDELLGDSGNDWLNGRKGNDILRGGSGDDFLTGEDGADLLYGDAGNDLIWGGAGNDILDGGADDDEMLAGDGDDVLYVELNIDSRVRGQGGLNTIIYV